MSKELEFLKVYANELYNWHVAEVSKAYEEGREDEKNGRVVEE